MVPRKHFSFVISRSIFFLNVEEQMITHTISNAIGSSY